MLRLHSMMELSLLKRLIKHARVAGSVLWLALLSSALHAHAGTYTPHERCGTKLWQDVKDSMDVNPLL